MGGEDWVIANACQPKPIGQIAEKAGIGADEVEPYGRYKAKIDLKIWKRLQGRPNGLYVLVTAITPTPLGEGKTTVTVGLSQAFNAIGKRSFATIRQASMGPVFGVKGGAAGGGRAQVVPLEEVNLHLTGDIHAVAAANNLLAAWIDTSVLLKNPYKIRPETITWRRVVDINDRALRRITVGQGGPQNGLPRETAFDITVASEVMACLALASDLTDLRRRLGRIVVAEDETGHPVTAEKMGCAGAMALMLKETIKPNLLQTLEGTPVFIHAGPFANIAHGNSSVVADRIALKLADVVVTEAGFAADMGAEKFFNIKCRASGLAPDVAVVVASIRALKAHGGTFKLKVGKDLPPELKAENLELLAKGCANLEKQIENVRVHGIPAVVAINRFNGDSPKEIALVRERAKAAGAFDAVECDVWGKGGPGGREVAEAVLRAAEAERGGFKPLYGDADPLEKKVDAIVRKVYGGAGAEFSPEAKAQLQKFTEWGFGSLPVCMAKTQYSLSHDPALTGRPSGFTVPVRELRLYAGAGFITAVCGEMNLMPGLGSTPGLLRMDIDADGNAVGLA